MTDSVARTVLQSVSKIYGRKKCGFVFIHVRRYHSTGTSTGTVFYHTGTFRYCSTGMNDILPVSCTYEGNPNISYQYDTVLVWYDTGMIAYESTVTYPDDMISCRYRIIRFVSEQNMGEKSAALILFIHHSTGTGTLCYHTGTVPCTFEGTFYK